MSPNRPNSLLGFFNRSFVFAQAGVNETPFSVRRTARSLSPQSGHYSPARHVPTESHVAHNRQANWVGRRACGGKWSGTGISNSGCNRPGRSLCLSSLLGRFGLICTFLGNAQKPSTLTTELSAWSKIPPSESSAPKASTAISPNYPSIIKEDSLNPRRPAIRPHPTRIPYSGIL